MTIPIFCLTSPNNIIVNNVKCVIEQEWGQHGWLLAKVLFLWFYSAHIWTEKNVEESLVNKAQSKKGFTYM